jgi:hypothetical protein
MIMAFDDSYNRESLKGEKEIYNFHLEATEKVWLS